LPSARHRTNLSVYISAAKAWIENRKKNLLNNNISPTRPHNMLNFSPLRLISFPKFGAPQQILTGFVSCLRYCSEVAHRRPTKLCTMLGHLLGWYTTYIFSGGSRPLTEFCQVKIHFMSKCCVLLYWQRNCTALQQRVSAKLCGVVQGMELRNFGRGRHLYAVRLSYSHICAEKGR